MTVPGPTLQAAPAGPLVLSARGIRKSFNGVEVLHGVDFDLRRGEIHGLVGQNGAGKSTLVKIIEGAYRGDSGEVQMDGAPLIRSGGSGSRRGGVAMVFQEFSLISTMSVGQNILLSREPHRFGLIDDGQLEARARDALLRVGADIDARDLVDSLPVGSRQIVEIAKAISQDASVLILDEPTASLTETEISALMAAIRRLTAGGISVIYISHHLDEVVAVCDRITVLRDGHVTMTAPTSETSVSRIIESMLGRSLESALAYQARPIDRTGEPLLRVRGLSNARLKDVSLDVYPGEIVGLAGLLGSGRSEVLRAVFGIDPLEGGRIEVRGRTVPIRRPADAIRAGIALVPEDRGRAGLVREHSVGDNILMSAWSRFARFGRVDDAAAKRSALGFVNELEIKTTGLSQAVKRLSGGNQQKVVVARNLSVTPSILLLDDPTVGVDVGSKQEILMQVRRLAAQGNGVLLVSSEFEELSGMADRVLVIRDGAIQRELDRSNASDLSVEGLSRAVQEWESTSSDLSREQEERDRDGD